jgi:hypothetical protein
MLQQLSMVFARSEVIVQEFHMTPQEQEQDFQALLQQLTPGIETVIEAALADREVVEPEPELTPEVLARVRSMIDARK